MKKVGTALAVLVLVLAGCGGGKSNSTAASGQSSTAGGSTPAPADPKIALKKTVQGFVDAFTSGNAGKLSVYLDGECGDTGVDASTLAQTKQLAEGHRIIVDSVVIGSDGTGGADKAHADGGSEEFKRLARQISTGEREDGKEHSFRLVDGDWFHMADPCNLKTSSPNP